MNEITRRGRADALAAEGEDTVSAEIQEVDLRKRPAKDKPLGPGKGGGLKRVDHLNPPQSMPPRGSSLAESMTHLEPLVPRLDIFILPAVVPSTAFEVAMYK